MRNIFGLACLLLSAFLVWGSAVAMALENLIPNHDFSQGADAEGVPLHWTRFARSDEAGFYLSDAQASIGGQSLYIFDRSSARGSGIRSARVPATAGERFLAEVDALAVRGNLTLYMDFLDARGTRVQAVFNSVPQNPDWQSLVVQGQAPEGTAYVTLILYSSVSNEGEGYFDNVRLYNITELTVHSEEATTEDVVRGPVIGFRPEDGAEVQVNPPPLVWVPLTDARAYIVELSQDPAFPEQATTRIADIDLPLYTHSHTLQPGVWYWRYMGVLPSGEVTEPSRVRSFAIPEGVAELPLPPTEEWMARIPTGHPRLFIRPENLADWRERLHGPSVESLFPQARTAALVGADYPDEPPNPRAGGTLDIDAWRAAGAQMSPPLDTLHDLAFLYLATGKEMYAEEGKQLLMHFARMDPSGLTSYRNGAPETAMKMLYYLPRVYTWLYDVLSEEERELVRNSARVRGQEAYSMIKGRPFETNPYGSHTGRMLGFLGQLALAFLGEIPEAEYWLDYVVKLMFAIYPAWGAEDGGYSEGLNYWSSYMNWVFDFFDAFEVATGISLYKKPFFQNTGYFAIYAGSPETRTPFSDGHNSAVGSGQRRVVTHLARMHQNTHYAWYVQQLGGPLERSAMHQLLLNYPSVPQATTPDDLPQSRWFRDVGWVTLHRNLLDPQQNMQFTFKSSPYGSVSHSHSDQNAFVLYAYGDGLAISSGYYPYYNSPHHAQWTNQTVSKNSLLIDGSGQKTASIDAKGQVLGFFHSDAYDYTAGDAAVAYDNAKLRRFTRHVLYLRPDVYVLVDDVRALQPVTIDWLLHSEFELHWDEQARVVRTQGRSAEMDVHFFTPEPLQVSVSDRYVPPPEQTSYVNAWHMTARLPGTWHEAAIVAVLTPRRLGGDGPKVVSGSALTDGDWLRIELVIEAYGSATTERIYMRFPEANQTADLADVRITALDRDGRILRALAIGEAAPAHLTDGIVSAPNESAVAVAWVGESATVRITTGLPRSGAAGLEGTRGDLVIVADFVPEEVWLDGTLLLDTEWVYDPASHRLRIVR